MKPGTGQRQYQAALNRALGPATPWSRAAAASPAGTSTNPGRGTSGLVDTSLIRLLTILVAVLAGLGVLNSVLMLTRERVHDLGIFKALGMTPQQAITMVTCWVIAPAIAAAVIALPAGMALQNAVIHAIARAEAARLPPDRPPPSAASCTSTPSAGSPCSPWPGWPSPSPAHSAPPPGPPHPAPPPPCAPNSQSATTPGDRVPTPVTRHSNAAARSPTACTPRYSKGYCWPSTPAATCATGQAAWSRCSSPCVSCCLPRQAQLPRASSPSRSSRSLAIQTLLLPSKGRSTARRASPTGGQLPSNAAWSGRKGPMVAANSRATITVPRAAPRRARGTGRSSGFTDAVRARP